MSAELRRKNLGKQYAVAHIPSRLVFAWVRPGDPLPKLVSYEGTQYLITQAHVDQAKANGRVKLVAASLEFKESGAMAVAGTSLVVTGAPYENPKGGIELGLRDSKWDKMKALGFWAGMSLAGFGCAALIAEGVNRAMGA